MPRSIDVNMGKDLLETLDRDILEVSVIGHELRMFVDTSYGALSFTEQDLVTLLEFLRSNLH